MRILGISIKKNEVWFSLLNGSNKSDVKIEELDKECYQNDSNNLMVVFKNIFSELLIRFHPDAVVYKLFIDADMDQIPYMHYSLGLLQLLCQEKNIPIKQRTTKWLSAKKNQKLEETKTYFNTQCFKTNESLQATTIAFYEFGV